MTYKHHWKRSESSDFTTDLVLRRLADLYKQRNEQYGDTWVLGGAAMKALFPEGVSLVGESDFIRFQLISMVVGKLTRYCQNFQYGGHADSMNDLSVYAAMLVNEDEWIASQKRKAEDAQI